MKTAKTPEQWERAKRMAFWDQSNLAYPKWHTSFASEKPAVVRQSINYMRPADLIELIGRKQFMKAWPTLRDLDNINANKKAILDAAWSLYVVGNVSFPVTAAVTRFHPKKMETLRTIAKLRENTSIYQVAQMVHRDYRRVHDDIKAFVDAGIATLLSVERNGKIAKSPRLFGVHIRNQPST
jgi:hypothetical protein